MSRVDAFSELAGVEEVSLRSAIVTFSPEAIRVSTGVVEAVWERTQRGVQMQWLARTGDADSWVKAEGDEGCDWALPELVDEHAAGELEAVTASVQQQVAYAADHIEVTLQFLYREAGFRLLFTLWVFPGVPGLRTQLALKPVRCFDKADLPSYLGGGRTVSLCLSRAAERIFAAGYFNDTQHRNYDHTPLLETRDWEGSVLKKPLSVEWANLVAVERGGKGLALVKESHKCVNQTGIETGGFVVARERLEVTGLGLTPVHYGGGFWADNLDHWRECWATWIVLYDDTGTGSLEAQRQLAVKRMDRARFPFRPKRDELVMANTWGSGGAGEGSREAAEESRVLAELHSAADLGIEVVQIDDGWQAEPGELLPTVSDKDWRPSATRWPEGWEPARREAQRLGLGLGLWFPWYVDIEKIAWNIEQGGFRRIKLDFMSLRSRHDLEGIASKVRDLVARFGVELGINWDATEESARMGYYFGREYGNIYLANRPNGPSPSLCLNHVPYIPRLMLRDAWHLAHYMNLNQIQFTVQNIDRVNSNVSNCREYTHAYCFAIAMMGVPLFFQETKFLSEAARAELRPLIAIFKRHREVLHAGFAMPIGAEPDDASWTGFQSHDPETESGCLLLFREVYSKAEHQVVCLHFLAGHAIEIEDTLSLEKWVGHVAADGCIVFHMPEPASFRLLRYAVKQSR